MSTVLHISKTSPQADVEYPEYIPSNPVEQVSYLASWPRVHLQVRVAWYLPKHIASDLYFRTYSPVDKIVSKQRMKGCMPLSTDTPSQ
jgi:hypothetical protein